MGYKSLLALLMLCPAAAAYGAPGTTAVAAMVVSDRAPEDRAVLRELLSGPAPRAGRAPDSPFTFRTLSGLCAVAQDRGLEGFYFSKLYLEEKLGAGLFAHHYDDYFGYADYLLMRQAAATYDGRQVFQAIRGKADRRRRNSDFNAALGAYVSGLQKNYSALTPSSWAQKARIYQIFPRAYNLAGLRGGAASGGGFFRDFSDSDFERIKGMGFDTVWTMGIYPVGVRGRSGTAGGSVYAIRDHGHVNPELGGDEAFRSFVEKAHGAGLKVIVDLVANHSSMDSVLLDEDPDYFIHEPAKGSRPEQAPPGYFSYKGRNGWLWVRNGGYDCLGNALCTWNDVAQFDYSNPALQEKQIAIALGLVRDFDVDGFRMDMAYQLLSSVFARNWGVQMPEGEFLERLIVSVRGLKPSAAFIAEAYGNQDDLSWAGFDAFYNKSEWGRPEGHAGWYDAFANPTPVDMAAALERAAFLTWRRGGASGVQFFINHDEPAAERVFGARLPAVAAATMFLPGAFLMYNGAEIGFDASVPNEHKILPFSVPVAIDWKGGNPASRRLFEKLFRETAELRSALGDYYIKPFPQQELDGWAGYVLQSKGSPRLKRALVFNYSAQPVRADLSALNLPGFYFSEMLEVGGYRLLAPGQPSPGGKQP